MAKPYKFDEGDRWPTGDPRGSSGLQALGMGLYAILMLGCLAIVPIGFPIAWLFLMSAFRDIVGNWVGSTIAVLVGCWLFVELVGRSLRLIQKIFGVR